MSTVRTTVTISGVEFGNPFENARGFRVIPVNINTNEKINQFKLIEDEKEERNIRQFTINMAEFTRLLSKGGWLAYIKENKVNEEGKTEKQILDERYEDQRICLNGATLVFDREEVRETVYDETKPIMNEDGSPKLDENEEQMYEPLIEKGKVVTKLVGYGELTFISLKLTDEGMELAKDKAYNKK